MTLDLNTPILVGVKTITQRIEDPSQAKNALELLIDAANLCAEDTSANPKQIWESLDAIICMKSLAPMENPSQLLGQALGSDAKNIVAEVGTLQQTAFDKACKAILEGADAVLVTGTETEYRKLRARIAGIEVADPPLSTAPPDELITTEADIIHPLEIEMKLHSAPAHYSLLENAFGNSKGLSPVEQRLATGKLWSRFSQVASQNPLAAFKEPKSAEEIATPGPKNRCIAAPYNKWNCSQINVDQASALLFMSVKKAQDLNIPQEKWIFPLAGAVSNHTIPIVQRKELHRCQGFQIVGKAALEIAGTNIEDIGIEDITFIDLYSCFPIAVWLQAQELGLDHEQQLTVTGGMTFSGGPFNSFVLGSLVRMVEVLREARKDSAKDSAKDGTKDNPKIGLVTSISGMVTKQGVGIWSTHPPQSTPKFLDLSKEVAEATLVCEVESDYTGAAITVASNLLYDREGKPERAVCIADTPEGKRTMAFSTQTEILELLASEKYIGRLDNQEIQISDSQEFVLSEKKNE